MLGMLECQKVAPLMLRWFRRPKGNKHRLETVVHWSFAEAKRKGSLNHELKC